MEEAMQMSDAEFAAWMDARVNLEFDPSTAIAWQRTAGLVKQGFSYALRQSTAAGENAAMYWAGRHVETGNPLYAVPGAAASLWTPDTYFDTFSTLAGAGIGSGGLRGFRAGKEITFGRNFRIAPFGNRTGHATGRFPHYHRRGIDPNTGLTRPGQGIGRHRSWDSRSTDKTWMDRF